MQTWIQCLKWCSVLTGIEDMSKQMEFPNLVAKINSEILPHINVIFRWDMLTSDLELIESVDGHYDVVYGTYHANYTR